MQPCYLPWLGYFDKMNQADIVIHYDISAWSKGSIYNRNRIRTRTDQGWSWLTVPTRAKLDTILHAVEIDPTKTNWAIKHIRHIEMEYARAPHKTLLQPIASALLSRQWTSLCDMNIAAIEAIAGLLIDNQAPMLRASELDIHWSNDRTEKLVQVCQHMGADTYVTSVGASALYNLDAFSTAGIKLETRQLGLTHAHPTYPQVQGDFMENMSALDMLLQVGADKSCELLASIPEI